jgi:hypothetical protein
MRTRTMTIGSVGSSGAITLNEDQARALLGILEDPGEVAQVVHYIRAEFLATAPVTEVAVAEVTIETPAPSLPDRHTLANESDRKPARGPRGNRKNGNNPPRRARKTKSLDLAVPVPTAPNATDRLIVPALPDGGIPLPSPQSTLPGLVDTTLAPAAKDGSGSGSVSEVKTKTPRKTRGKGKVVESPAPAPVKPTLVQDFVVTLPDGRETYVAVYSDGSVVHETSAAALAA